MRVAFGAFGTETNTFSPVPTELDDFDRDQSRMRDSWSEILAPFDARSAKCGGGFYAFAPPAGVTRAEAYTTLRDDLLGRIERALPLDAVILLLHGAMVAEGFLDCEGDTLRRVRGLVGDRTLVGATLDPHAHLTTEMVRASDLLIAYKEYPHVDAQDCARELARRLLDMYDRGERYEKAVVDCRMISLYHTNREPMRGLVDRVRDMQEREGVRSLSIVHGFPWGDVPEMGTKVLAYGDSATSALRAAESIGGALVALRGQTFEPPTPLDDAIRIVEREPGRVVLAEISDNPGGGAPGDGTWLLRALKDGASGTVAFGTLWDPAAVASCKAVGIGARVCLQAGGRSSLSGEPFALDGTVTALAGDFHTEVTGGHDADTGYGDVAAVRTDAGLDVVLATRRSQVFARALFERLGIRLDRKHVVAVKSANHFYHDFAPIAQRVVYVDAPGALRADFQNIPYQNVRRPLWPLDDA